MKVLEFLSDLCEQKVEKNVSRLPHLAQKQNYANCLEKAISRKLISQKMFWP